MTEFEDEYLCVGVCMPDPDSGYCLGCGRPPLPVSFTTQGIVAEVVRPMGVVDEGCDGDSPGQD